MLKFAVNLLARELFSVELMWISVNETEDVVIHDDESVIERVAFGFSSGPDD